LTALGINLKHFCSVTINYLQHYFSAVYTFQMRSTNLLMYVCVIRSLIVFIVVVTFCLLPVHVLILLTDYELVDTERLYVLAYFSLYMFAINSVFNAVIITTISHQYRRRVLVLLGVQRCRRRRRRRRRLLSDTGDWTQWTGSRTRRTYDDHGASSSSSFNWHSTRV